MVNYSKWDVVLNWCKRYPESTFIAFVKTNTCPRAFKEFIADSFEEAKLEAQKHCQIHGWKLLGIFPAKRVFEAKSRYPSHSWIVRFLREEGIRED